jgi:hypothetical protein
MNVAPTLSCPRAHIVYSSIDRLRYDLDEIALIERAIYTEKKRKGQELLLSPLR